MNSGAATVVPALKCLSFLRLIKTKCVALPVALPIARGLFQSVSRRELEEAQFLAVGLRVLVERKSFRAGSSPALQKARRNIKMEWLFFVGIVVVWFVMNRWVLPRLGIPT